MQTYGLDPDHVQISSRSNECRTTASSHGFEPDTHDGMTTMDWRISAPGLTALLLCFSTSGRYYKELDADGRDRVRALLRGWVDHVLTPEGGPYVLGGPEGAVPIRDGTVMLDLLMSDQAEQGVTTRSRTLLSMHVCLCIGNVFLAELLQLVAWPCDMAEFALIRAHTHTHLRGSDGGCRRP